MIPGPEGNYLARARSLCVRGEELGGSLVAWGATQLALGWDFDAIEDAVKFATSIGVEALSPERAWACGLAEGEIESLSPDGEGILAWGPALLSATALAQVARAGEVLIDGNVRALRGGLLSLRGVRDSADVAQSVRGWTLDHAQPWTRPASGDERAPEDDPTRRESDEMATVVSVGRAVEPLRETLVARVRSLARGAQSAAAFDSLAAMRRARALVEDGPAPARCRASLALALTLSVAGRVEEALLEAMDALARAREAHDAKAIDACIALLAKLYGSAGHVDAATALRDTVSRA
jgi:hypothetical protein